MTNTDFHARRTELSNTFAAAGAELLDYMRCAGALAAIPNTQQYVVAGDIAAIRAQLDTVAPQRRMRHGDRPEQPLYFGPEAGQARRWAALITSAGHGMLQEYGTKFEFAQPGQEVLEVMEILPGAPATANKAAEEGEYYAMQARRFCKGDNSWTDWQTITNVEYERRKNDPSFEFKELSDMAKEVVAADRASRQVANKAEVNLSKLKRVDFEVEDGQKYICGNPDGVWVRFADVEALIEAAPPATTGASTTREAVLDEVIDALTKRFVVKDEPWVAIGIVRALKRSAPASTVLTDERTPMMYATKRIDNGQYGAWLHRSAEAARIHLEGNGPAAPNYTVVPMVEVTTQAAQHAESGALAEAIARAAIKRGIINEGTALTGPQLVMLCDDLAAQSQGAQAALAAVKPLLENILERGPTAPTEADAKKAINIIDAALAAKAEAPAPEWGRVRTVGDMVRNLLTLDQAEPIFSAFHVDFDGARRCRTSPISISHERVIDGKWVDSTRKDVPYSTVVWAKPDERAQQAAAPDLKVERFHWSKRGMEKDPNGYYVAYSAPGTPEAPKELGLDIAVAVNQRISKYIAGNKPALMLLNEEELAALYRFQETCEDSDSGGYDVDKDMMKRLAAIGVIESKGFGRYQFTEFGDFVVERAAQLDGGQGEGGKHADQA